MCSRICLSFLKKVYNLVGRFVLSALGDGGFQLYCRAGRRIHSGLFGRQCTVAPASTMIEPNNDALVDMPPAIPGWVLDEMRDIAQEIDPILYPDNDFIDSCQYYAFPVIKEPGDIYWKMMKLCSSDHYTHVFALPWMKRGGADLVALAHINVVLRSPKTKVMVLLTESGDSPWLHRIPQGVDVIDVSSLVLSDISYDHLLLVLVRMLVQLRVDVLHIINSKHAWELVLRYGRALTQQTRIFASLYCDDYDENNQPVGYGREYLQKCYKFVSLVFCDNYAYPRLLQMTYGYRPELFQVLKSPADVPVASPLTRKPRGRRVLWAGRLDRQKRPDLLLGVAQALPDVEFGVYGEVVLGHDMAVVESLGQLGNVKLMGSFDGVESLPFDEYSAFLYTSQWDGTPTIVIAAVLASMPVVASCVGGVGEIITMERGYPVADIENLSSYISCLQSVFSDVIGTERKVSSARQYVLKEHALGNFEHVLRGVEGYVPEF